MSDAREAPVGREARGVTPPASVPSFVVRTLAVLLPAFAFWYLAGPILVAPALWIVQAIAHLAFGDIVRAVEQAGSVATFVTTLRPATPGAAGALVTVDVNVLLYSFGMPLFAALTLAAHERAWKRHLAVGYAAMLPFVAWGTLADFLKNVAIASGPALASQTGFVAWQREAIAFAYQFGALILPAVVPAVLWVAMHGAFLARLRAPR